MIDVNIFDMEGIEMDSEIEYEFNVGDYIECRAADDISEDYPPKFVWWRSIQVSNLEGPKVINYQNTDDNHNR